MKRLIYLLPVVLLFIYTGCTKDNSTGPSGTSSGELKITMVDNPADFDEVNVMVTKVEVHMAGDSSENWFVVNSVPHTYNLLDLRNGASVVLGDTFLTVGHYTQIRLILGDSNNVVVNGIPFPLVVPSGTQTGIKLNHEFDIQAGNLYELLLDFDANRSIHITGNGQYIMNPVIRVTPVVTSGSISGQVLPLDADANVSTMIGQDTISTQPNSGGFFSLMTLPAGTYDLLISPNNLAYRDTTVAGIIVAAGKDTNIGTITLPTQ